ncbi:MAG: hypothetical protein A2W25_00975 [candidate division Zixibacteria bacterium RBG_16_53_22]|nr:MAG: hypothetical protein A2W25_00975 [candidate division Zixibacteria bacterium RBG_16_53_22]
MLGKILIYVIVTVLTVLVLNPHYFTYTYFLTRPLLQPFAMERMLVFGVPITGLMALQLALFTVFWGIVRKDFSFRVPNILPLYILLFFALMSFINSVDVYASMAGFAKLVTAVMSYVLVYNVIKEEKDARKLLLVIVLATLIPMAVGYYQFFTESGGKAIGGLTNRVKGTLGMANAYGIYLALSLCATAILLLHPRWRVNKRLLGMAAASMVVSSVIALNRGTWIALSFAVAVATMFYIRKIRIRWILFGAVVVFGLFSNLIYERFQQLEGGEHNEMNTLERRISYWKSTWAFVPEHLLVGWGIGTAQQVMEEHFDVADVTHNDYLRLLLETGIFGLAAYLFFLGRQAWLALRRLRYKNLWYINYPALITIFYFIIISMPQNIYDHMVNLPLFFSLIAISYRLVEFELSRTGGAVQHKPGLQELNRNRRGKQLVRHAASKFHS